MIASLIALCVALGVAWLGARDTNHDRRTFNRLYKDPAWRGARGWH